jgi:hypothetical protein
MTNTKMSRRQKFFTIFLNGRNILPNSDPNIPVNRRQEFLQELAAGFSNLTVAECDLQLDYWLENRPEQSHDFINRMYQNFPDLVTAENRLLELEKKDAKNSYDFLFMKNGDILIAVERNPSDYEYYKFEQDEPMPVKISPKKFRRLGKRAYHWEYDIKAADMAKAQEIALDDFFEKTEKTKRYRELGYNAVGIA